MSYETELGLLSKAYDKANCLGIENLAYIINKFKEQIVNSSTFGEVLLATVIFYYEYNYYFGYNNEFYNIISDLKLDKLDTNTGRYLLGDKEITEQEAFELFAEMVLAISNNVNGIK